MKISTIQMVSTPQVDQNLSVASDLISRAAGAGADMIVLPEYFCLFGLHDTDKLAHQEPYGHGRLQDFLANIALKENVYIVGGTIPISGKDADHVWNTTLTFDPSGQVIARYDKIHLFSFAQGNESYDESRTLNSGSKTCTFKINKEGVPWTFGLSICYDIRFPELYRQMGQVDCHIVPAAFTFTTGQAHWDILLRARAIENQSYLAASAQGGTHLNSRKTWGHSMMIDPWGLVLDSLESGPGFVSMDLDKNVLQEIRAKLPALQHRKL